ncbi:MAG: serine/threonine protein kinase, partial [Myxococcales bacterium]|nr:serine/threonine protein kinase [Myxococcales bacterium]
QGRDLGTIIAEDSPLAAQRVVHIMTQVCEALDEAHSVKVIHRDLKPANIVCFDHRRTQDFVKVLDFGIAKIVDPDENYQALTRDGIVCGTPAYMSPEQVQGFELDNRSDLFSLGIILYQTLTGQLPFFADSAVEVATKIVIEEPKPPSQVRPDWSYPPELEAVVLRLLAKKKESRFSNAIEVRDALEACLRTLRDRRDASLEMRPDEVAGLYADVDQRLEGAATVRLSSEHLAAALPRVPPRVTTAPPLGRPPPSSSTAPTSSRLMSRPSTAFREEPGRDPRLPLWIGLGIFAVAAGVLATWLLIN